MIPITDEEAQNWPLDGPELVSCEECSIPVDTQCGYCGQYICESLDCIKTHASKGCYNNHRHANDSQADGYKHSALDAGPEHDPPHTVSEPALDGQAVEEPSIPKGR